MIGLLSSPTLYIALGGLVLLYIVVEPYLLPKSKRLMPGSAEIVGQEELASRVGALEEAVIKVRSDTTMAALADPSAAPQLEHIYKHLELITGELTEQDKTLLGHLEYLTGEIDALKTAQGSTAEKVNELIKLEISR